MTTIKKIILGVLAVAFVAFFSITIYKAYFEPKHDHRTTDIIEELSDEDELVDCDVCHIAGNLPGQCGICKGTGISGYTPLGPIECPICMRNKGKCFNCQGTGMIPRSQLGKAILPIPGINNTSNPPPIREVPCTYCNGTGYVLKEYGIGHSFVHENAHMEKCSVCESVHCNLCTNHILCPSCGGNKTRPAY